MPDFIPGAMLSNMFYHECVRPILEADFKQLKYAAALIGSGSEVLGFDTPMSSDHHWGPRVMLFLAEHDFDRCRTQIHDRLANKLPHTFKGYSTNFTLPDPNDSGVQQLESITTGPVNHRVEIFTIEAFFNEYLGVDPFVEIDVADWLTIPSQKLRTIVAGAIYHDAVGLTPIQKKFKFYPKDIWLYLLAAGWTRISQEEAFVGRTGLVGDELGSGIIASRLVRDLMRLCFLMERTYAPYAKWFGSAFAQLQCAPELLPTLQQVGKAADWEERQAKLSRAYSIVAGMQNALGLTPPLPEQVTSYFSRPFQVIHGGRFARALRESIQDDAVRDIPVDIGSIDQFSDSTDLMEAVKLRPILKQLYKG